MVASNFAKKSADEINAKSMTIISSNVAFIKMSIGIFLLLVAMIYFKDTAALWLLLGFSLGRIQGLLRCQYLVEFIKRNNVC